MRYESSLARYAPSAIKLVILCVRDEVFDCFLVDQADEAGQLWTVREEVTHDELLNDLYRFAERFSPPFHA